MEYRWADGQYDRLPGLAAELVRDRVDLIVAVAPPAALAAKAATSSIPIVFSSGADPVKLGLVASFNKPGGNVTGVTFIVAELGPKILEVILELIPQAKTVAYLANPDNQSTVTQAKDVQAAAQSVGREALIVYANSGETIDRAFSDLAERKPGAVLIGTDAFFLTQKDRMVSLPRRYGIPAIYSLREYPMDGGLLSYGTSLPDAYRQIGLYAGKILKGTKPADLPVLYPSRFELVINLKTAKALGLNVPPTLIARADEVIE
jgi:putative ABC transport system substrate-binding protein